MGVEDLDNMATQPTSQPLLSRRSSAAEVSVRVPEPSGRQRTRLSRVPWNFGGGPWRQATPWSVWQVGGVGARSRCRARAAGRVVRWVWPLTRRNWRRAWVMPAAHQRRAMSWSRQRLTLRAWSRPISIMDSIAFVERIVRCRVGCIRRASTVSVSAIPSRRLAAADGWVESRSLANSSSNPLPANAVGAR